MPNLEDYEPALKYGADLSVNVDLADIRDNNGNEILEFDSVSGAVNYVRVQNSTADAPAILSAQGDDTNIPLDISGKGSSPVRLGSYDTGTIVSGSVTINAQRGRITTSALAVASATVANFDLINNRIFSTSVVALTLDQWTGSAGQPVVTYGTTVAGRSTFAILNVPVNQAGSALLNGVVGIRFVVL